MFKNFFKNSITTVFVALLALAIPAGASAAGGAIVFSKVTEDHREYKEGETVLPPKAPEGGLFAVKDRHLNQLTENPADTEPSFSADGHTIAFVREGDVYAMRADGSGQKRLTSGAELDSRPLVSPNGRIVVFERRTAADAPRDLYTVSVKGGGVHAIGSSVADEHEASFSPDGRTIAFVRTSAAGGGANDDIYTVRPSGAKLHRLTRTAGLDEYAPNVLNETIVYSRGENSEGPSAYADVYKMDMKGKHAKKVIAGAGSAYVEDVTGNGRTILFRRDQGLWVKQIGGKGRKLSELPDNAKVNSVFSSDGKRVATFTETPEGEQSLSLIDVATGRSSYAEVVGYSSGEVTTAIGPIVAWQPVPHR
jgi:dipeptidyl aminopeptidase/acylaminoacyl peptidase